MLAAVVFIIAAITDYLDGWAARVYKEASDFGRVVDPLADKVLTTAAFVAFAVKGYVAWWMVTVVLIRDVGTTYLRSFADTVGKPMQTSLSAKSKTFVQLTFIITVLVLEAALRLPLPSLLLDMIFYCLQPQHVNTVMLGVTLFTAWTGIEYCIANHTVVKYWWAQKRRSLRRWLEPEHLPMLLALAVSSVGGVGFVPKAPGTVASALALGIVATPLASDQHAEWQWTIALGAFCLLAFVLGLLTISHVEKQYGNDPSVVVLDEVLGMWVTLLSPIIPKTAGWVLAAFVLFRLFDIWKPLPVRWFNARKGALYVLLDDVVAGVCSALLLHLAYWAMNWWFSQT